MQFIMSIEPTYCRLVTTHITSTIKQTKMKIKREDEELYGKKPSKLALFWANGFI